MSKETSPSSSSVDHLVTATSKVKDYENESAVASDINHIWCQMSTHTQARTFLFVSPTVAKDWAGWFHIGLLRVTTFRDWFLRVLVSLLIVAHISSLCFLIFICLKMCHFAFIFRKWSWKKNLFHMLIFSLLSRTHHLLSNPWASLGSNTTVFCSCFLGQIINNCTNSRSKSKKINVSYNTFFLVATANFEIKV